MVVWTYPDKKGLTLEAHWEQLESAPAYEQFRERMEKNKPERHEPPEEALHIWKWFWELRQTAFIPGLGQTALSYVEIGEWSRQSGIRLEPYMTKMLRGMDEAYLTATSREANKRSVKGGSPPKK